MGRLCLIGRSMTFSFVLLGQNYLHLYSVSMELSDHSKLLAKLCTTSTKKDISSTRINENTHIVQSLIWYSCCKYKSYLVLLTQLTSVVESFVQVNAETVNPLTLHTLCRSSAWSVIKIIAVMDKPDINWSSNPHALPQPEVMGTIDGCLFPDVAPLNTSHVFPWGWAPRWDRYSVMWVSG